MMKMGVIRESGSPYASPVVVVKRKDNTNRICVDYRRLNKLTVFDPEPMPTAEHLFQKLKVFYQNRLKQGLLANFYTRGRYTENCFCDA